MNRTQIVRGLRVILPLAALAILSMLFLLARKPDPESAIPYAQGRLEDLARSPGMTGPTFSTVTAQGATVTLSAARADPAGGTARDLTLDWQARDGTGAHLTAGAAEQAEGRIRLTGDVDIALASGWRLLAPQVEADTAASRLTAPGPLRVTAPFGTIEAGGMVLSAADGDRQVLELNRGVRLIYRP